MPYLPSCVDKWEYRIHHFCCWFQLNVKYLKSCLAELSYASSLS
ncbi:hypothetical protein FDUTEX481_07862 [Tolypothrix sp. PCC 7601]|nr:hypothetical protein FDUTEX481_07862 [Tolypothrix sp. PCC 7601]